MVSVNLYHCLAYLLAQSYIDKHSICFSHRKELKSMEPNHYQNRYVHQLHKCLVNTIITLSHPPCTALAVYSRSPAAFKALQDFKILQLPGVSTLKSYVRNNKEAPGECAKRLANECQHYNTKVQEHVHTGKPTPPLSEGALIVDEVKVAAKLHWNSCDDSLVGHSMTPLELSTLQDLYLTLDDTKAQKADYVLQTLWRHSHSDIVGPYYTSSGPFKAKYMLACVTDAMRQFHAFQFTVSLLILDGGSSNLTTIKLLMVSKVFLDTRNCKLTVTTYKHVQSIHFQARSSSS